MKTLNCSAVLFDFDGTLTRPEAIDFVELRGLLGCPPGTPLIEYINALPSAGAQAKAWSVLEGFELAAARASVPNDGAEELIATLRGRGIGLGILTRNSRASVLEALKNFHSVTVNHFSVVISRESEGRPKPHPDGVLGAARALGVPPARLLVVGDYVFDIAAGKAAGAPTVFLTNGRAAPPTDPAPDVTIAKLAEIIPMLGT